MLQTKLLSRRGAPALRRDECGLALAAKLTEEQMCTLGLLLEGRTNPSIGERLGVSENAVKGRIYNICNLTGMGSRVELVLFVEAHPWLKRLARIAAAGQKDGLSG